LDPKQLGYFLSVVREGSFVKAAVERDIAQPSLSQQIKKLEDELGAPLFDRLGRSVKLTPYGKALVPHAEAVVRQIEEARQAIEALRSPTAGSIRVGVLPTILPYAMVAPFAAFQEQNPAVRLEIVENTTERLIEALRLGALDLAILALPLKHPEIVFSELLREPLLAALPPGHPLASESSVAICQLSGERMILLREGHCLRNDVLTTCTRANVEFTQVFESDQLGSIFAMVAAGFGISLVPALAAPQATGCKLLPVKPQAMRRIAYAIAAGHTLVPVQKSFIAFLRKYAWPLP
jgi:LysR family hydrogen peroxide-inducible transcriptional activator